MFEVVSVFGGVWAATENVGQVQAKPAYGNWVHKRQGNKYINDIHCGSRRIMRELVY